MNSFLPANAQGVLEEIVVTATKREQDVQDVGGSVTAISGLQIRERYIPRNTRYFDAGL